MARALAEKHNWSSMNILSIDLSQMLKSIGQDDLPMETKIEDQTYIDKAIGHVQVAKAFDLLDHAEKAFHESQKALNLIDKLVRLRREQKDSDKVRGVNYESLLAPFDYRAGDFLATYILLNTDELGTVKPFQEENLACDDEEEEEEAEGNGGVGAASEEQHNQEEERGDAPEEEEKAGAAEPAQNQMTTMINTMA